MKIFDLVEKFAGYGFNKVLCSLCTGELSNGLVGGTTHLSLWLPS